jgi:flagellin
MPMTINTNVASMVAQRNLFNSGETLNSSLERLSSGLRINKAADDASGISIADKLRTQANTISQGLNNANDGIGTIQIADKAMDEQVKLLSTIKTKATQAATDGQTDSTRQAIQEDVSKLLKSFDSISDNTSFNGNKLLNGDFNSTFQVGNIQTNISIDSTNSDNLSLTQDGKTTTLKEAVTNGVTTKEGAMKLMELVDSAIGTLDSIRGGLGSNQNQLTSQINNMSITQVNVKSAESQIRDVDYAEESANFQKYNLLAQSGSYALSQANGIPQNVMQLLQ